MNIRESLCTVLSVLQYELHSHRCKVLKLGFRASTMAQWVRVLATKTGSLRLIPGVLIIEAENRILKDWRYRESPSAAANPLHRDCQWRWGAEHGPALGGSKNLTWKCRAFMGNGDPAEAVGRAVGGLASEIVFQSMPLGIYFGKIKQAISLAFKTQRKKHLSFLKCF